ncbi:related to elongation factor 1-gamma [Fusarium oxysporum]|uniref:Related to elongation factor 1-gamma n=2 Tax=Fusarium oxysporum TaxID=5507 RepID=A0A2H3SPU0_FUSOX|nr:Glutathione S-transferase-like protein FUS3 [Fusarium oxysporum f. sp. cubense]SCO78486.1 related to elongation factor 1-gamma [Fusarium oxysporum]
MGSIGTIWTYPFNPRAMKVQAVAAMNGRTIDHAPNFAMGKTNKSSEFLADFPLGRVPTFKSIDGGLSLFESDAIAQYAAESGPASTQLLGSTAAERAVIRQWISFADHELFEPLTPMIMWRYGMGPFNQETDNACLDRLNISLEVLEKQLKGRQYIATKQLSLADISVVAGLYWGFAQVIDAEMRGKYSLTTDWYLRVLQDERLQSAFGDKNFIELRRTAH